jgi:hypothetical protein
MVTQFGEISSAGRPPPWRFMQPVAVSMRMVRRPRLSALRTGIPFASKIWNEVLSSVSPRAESPEGSPQNSYL